MIPGVHSVIDLENKYSKMVQEILKNHVPHCNVYAFGSRVTGKSSKFSDLDLAVEGKSELDLQTLVDLKNAFRESDLPFRVDVLDWLEISDDFRNCIKEECITIQERVTND